MALLIVLAMITLYSIVLTMLHMKQLKDLEELRKYKTSAALRIEYFRFKILNLNRELKRVEENAEADWIACKATEKRLEAELKEANRINERLLDLNNRLMERKKMVTR